MKKEVKNILQGNKGMNNALCKTERHDAFNDVTIKLIDPNNELNPAKCKLKNSRSIEDEFIIERGTQKVQPAFTPPSINIKNKEPRINHKLKAFNRGNIICRKGNRC